MNPNSLSNSLFSPCCTANFSFSGSLNSQSTKLVEYGYHPLDSETKMNVSISLALSLSLSAHSHFRSSFLWEGDGTWSTSVFCSLWCCENQWIMVFIEDIAREIWTWNGWQSALLHFEIFTGNSIGAFTMSHSHSSSFARWRVFRSTKHTTWPFLPLSRLVLLSGCKYVLKCVSWSHVNCWSSFYNQIDITNRESRIRYGDV